MDFPGLLLIIGAMQCLLLALYWAGVSKPWDSNDVIGSLLGFGLLAVAFAAVEYQQGQYAMLVHKLLKKREVWVGNAFSFFISGSLFVLVYFLPIYFQAILGCSAVESGIRHLALVIPICKYCPSILMSLRCSLTISSLHDYHWWSHHPLWVLRAVDDHRVMPRNYRRWAYLHL